MESNFSPLIEKDDKGISNINNIANILILY
jgi:hypothetical protein